MTIWKDIDISLDMKTSGDINDMTDEQAVKNSLINIFQTLRGERRMLPTFATSLHNYLFEQLDETTAYAIGNELYNVVQMWDDRIEITDLLVFPNHDKNLYEITVSFKVKSFTNINIFKTTLYPL